MHLTIREEFAVDLHGHLDHVARDFLFWIFVAGVVSLDVAIVALHTEPGGEGPHDLDHFRTGGDLQNLEVGRVRHRPFGLFLFLILFRFLFILSLLLGAQGQQEQQRGND